MHNTVLEWQLSVRETARMQGLEFLHSHGVIVMDIKPDNIFCNCSSTFQIGDFGMAVVSSLNWVRLPPISASVMQSVSAHPILWAAVPMLSFSRLLILQAHQARACSNTD